MLSRSFLLSSQPPRHRVASLEAWWRFAPDKAQVLQKVCPSTLPETNGSPLKIGLPNRRKVVFQPSIFRGYVSFREGKSRRFKKSWEKFMHAIHGHIWAIPQKRPIAATDATIPKVPMMKFTTLIRWTLAACSAGRFPLVNTLQCFKWNLGCCDVSHAADTLHPRLNMPLINSGTIHLKHSEPNLTTSRSSDAYVSHLRKDNDAIKLNLLSKIRK